MAEAELERVFARHRAFWSREPVEKPILSVERYEPLDAVEMRLADGSPVREDMYLTPDLLDPELMLELEETPRPPRGEPDRPGGISRDVLIVRRPMSKMCWVEAVMGCAVRVRAASGSIYSEPYLDSPAELWRIPSTEDNPWLELLQDYTRTLAEHAQGRYHVSQCLMRGTIDLVAAVLGYDRMCAAFYDHPREVHKLTELCVDVFLKVAEAQYAVIPRLAGGYATYFELWAPGSVIRSQCDASAATSAKMYEEFFFPYEEEIFKQFDYSIVHLHSGFLHTVPTFLKTDYPTSIQVSLDTGSTPETPHTLIPTFKRILEKKPLFIVGPLTQAELDELLRELPATGLYIGGQLMD